MPKTEIVPCNTEEINNIIEAAIDNDFFYLLFKIAKKTGRRLGEYYGEPEMKVVKIIKLRNKTTGKIKEKKIRKATGKWFGGVLVKDIDYERKVMMTQVLKRRQRVYKEALLDEELIYLLKKYISKEQLGLEEFLFRKVSYRQIQNRIVFYAKKAKVPHKVSFHNFRHYFITELSKLGYSHSDIAKLTGHTTVGVISNYDHTIASDIRDRVMKDIKSL